MVAPRRVDDPDVDRHPPEERIVLVTDVELSAGSPSSVSSTWVEIVGPTPSATAILRP